MEPKENLVGKKVAILATDGFEASELMKPREALLEAGADVQIVAPHDGEIRSWKDKDWGDYVKVDRVLHDVKPDEYDALMLPGGVINADRLRTENAAVQFVSEFVESGKPIAAICHAAWTLVETNKIHGRTLTSWPSLKTDIQNAGALWVDREVVTDNGLVTSRKPDDLPAFNRQMIEEFAEGIHRTPACSESRDSLLNRML
ncbi:MAG: type 1 glutamine amidotransferase domain-containing protein [Bdellovibrionales bacterium]